MLNKNELYYKLEAIIEYLKKNNGYEYKVFNRTCPLYNREPDSNIVEYAEDVKYLIEMLIKYCENNTINID